MPCASRSISFLLYEECYHVEVGLQSCSSSYCWWCCCTRIEVENTNSSSLWCGCYIQGRLVAPCARKKYKYRVLRIILTRSTSYEVEYGVLYNVPYTATFSQCVCVK